MEHNGLTDESSACATPEWPDDVPPPLAVTGGTVSWTIAGLASMLLIAGAVLMIARRRRQTVTTAGKEKEE